MQKDFKISYNGDPIFQIYNKQDLFEILSIEQLDYFLSHKVWDLMELHLNEEQQLYLEKKLEKKSVKKLENVMTEMRKV